MRPAAGALAGAFLAYPALAAVPVAMLVFRICRAASSR